MKTGIILFMLVFFVFLNPVGTAFTQETVSSENGNSSPSAESPSSLNNLSETHDPVNNTAQPTQPDVEIPSVSSIFFSSSNKTIDTKYIPVLENAASMLENKPRLKIQIRGYSDSSGTTETNYRLARERAEEVLGYFRKNHPSIERERITVFGFGSDKEFEDGMTARRVEFIIFD